MLEADAPWSTPAIFAEAVSIGPEVLLIAAFVLLLAAASLVTYLVGGYVAIHRVAAGSRSPSDVVVAAVAALIGAYLVLAALAGRGSYSGFVPPAIHAVAAWRGRRHAERGPVAGAPPPPPEVRT